MAGKIFPLFLLLLMACGGKEPQKIKIGFSMDTLKEEHWARDRDLIVQYAAERGAEVLVQVANGNDQLQNEQAENLLTRGVDVLLVAPHNGKTAAAIVESAHRAGVPVIAYDRIINDCDLDLYASFDNEKVGELQAQYLIERAPKGNYILLGGAPTDYNATLFRKGQMNILQPLIDKGDIKVILDQWCKEWQALEALKHTENGLTLAKNNVQAAMPSSAWAWKQRGQLPTPSQAAEQWGQRPGPVAGAMAAAQESQRNVRKTPQP